MPAKAKIRLLIGKEIVTIDKEDLDILISLPSQSVVKDCRTMYVQCCISRKKTIKLHQLIMNKHFGKTPDGMVIDHVDRNGLNNSKNNLRFVSLSNSMLNTRKRIRKTTSRFKGVYLHKKSNKWAASFKNTHLGLFSSEEIAHEAYKNASKDYAEHIHYDEKV